MEKVWHSHVKMQRPLLHTLSAFNNPCMRGFPADFRSSNSLSTVAVCDSDVHTATRRLQPSKSVGLDGSSVYIKTSWSDILVPVLQFIFNLSLSRRNFLTLWKQVAVVPIF
jgi:hypothetical protein